MPIPTIGYAAKEESGVLQPWKFEQRDVGPDDVHIRVVACGVCKTDVITLHNTLKLSTFPMVPGHEIAGYVEAVGANVTKFKAGEKAGLGIIIDSCQSCRKCNEGNVQYCKKRVFTTMALVNGSRSFGGYARDVVCNERYVVKFPENLDLYEGASLLCAGITAYSPMRKFGMDQPGKKLGVIGLGGVGHMAVKLGVAFGLEVTVISHSESKREEALGVLGAQHFLNSMDTESYTAAMDSLDFIINTVTAEKDLTPYMSLLDVNGIMVNVGISEKTNEVSGIMLVNTRRMLTGSLVGSVEETEDLLKFAVENKSITPMTEKISMDYVNTALERMMNSDVHYRFVLDVENTCPRI